MTASTNVSRRDFVKGAAITSGLVLGFHVGFRKLPFAEAAETSTFAPNAFLSIDETGLVTIVASRSEMGTGIKTDLPLVLADELDADWNKVEVVTRNTATRTPTARAAPGNSLGRCGWRAPLQGRCSKPPPRRPGMFRSANAARKMALSCTARAGASSPLAT